jgi:hypothetical protein
MLFGIKRGGVVFEELNQGAWLRALIEDFGLAFVDFPASAHGALSRVVASKKTHWFLKPLTDIKQLLEQAA